MKLCFKRGEKKPSLSMSNFHLIMILRGFLKYSVSVNLVKRCLIWIKLDGLDDGSLLTPSFNKHSVKWFCFQDQINYFLWPRIPRMRRRPPWPPCSNFWRQKKPIQLNLLQSGNILTFNILTFYIFSNIKYLPTTKSLNYLFFSNDWYSLILVQQIQM